MDIRKRREFFLTPRLSWGVLVKRYLFLYNNKIKAHQNDNDITKHQIKNLFCVCIHLAAILKILELEQSDITPIETQKYFDTQ